jgi:hypothetical protein
MAAKVCYRFDGASSRGLGHRSLRGAKAPGVWTPSGPFAICIVEYFRLWAYEELAGNLVLKSSALPSTGSRPKTVQPSEGWRETPRFSSTHRAFPASTYFSTKPFRAGAF